MFGFLDCMLTVWKNCPVAWQGSFKGKEKKSSIVLEIILDPHQSFGHLSHGSAGTQNDPNILNLFLFFVFFVNGKFAAAESDADVVPFYIGDNEFQKLFLPVDGIYPTYSRFGCALEEPVTDEKSFNGWQESCRKDVKRAFEALQGKFRCMARNIHTMDMNKIGNMFACCLIVHNM